MFCDYIRIAVKNILDESNDGVERACGSCNPSCGDLTRFICFGHTISEIDEWLNRNPDILKKCIQEEEDELDADYTRYTLDQQNKDKLNYAKTFCPDCSIFIDMKNRALMNHASIFDAVNALTEQQKECLTTCIKFKDSFAANSEELMLKFADFIDNP